MSFTPSENPITHPERESYTQLRPFRFWCQKVLPLVYDDSLSYYELLCKVVDYLNKTMEDVDHMNTDMDTLYSNFQEFQEGTIRIYNELVAYVNNYFDNLDVQEEINNKLDEMVTSGELVTVLQPTIAEEVNAWLTEHITPTQPVIDSSLSVSGAGADAKVVGDLFSGLVNINDIDDTYMDMMTHNWTIGNLNASGILDTSIRNRIVNIEFCQYNYDLQIMFKVPMTVIMCTYNSSHELINRTLTPNQDTIIVPANTIFRLCLYINDTAIISPYEISKYVVVFNKKYKGETEIYNTTTNLKQFSPLWVDGNLNASGKLERFNNRISTKNYIKFTESAKLIVDAHKVTSILVCLYNDSFVMTSRNLYANPSGSLVIEKTIPADTFFRITLIDSDISKADGIFTISEENNSIIYCDNAIRMFDDDKIMLPSGYTIGSLFSDGKLDFIQSKARLVFYDYMINTETEYIKVAANHSVIVCTYDNSFNLINRVSYIERSEPIEIPANTYYRICVFGDDSTPIENALDMAKNVWIIKKKTTDNFNVISVMESFAVIGDSLSCGFVSDGGTNSYNSTMARIAKRNWPSYLELDINRPFTNLARGGSAARDWRYGSTALDVNINTADIDTYCYMLALGVNDLRQHLTIGSASDIKTNRNENSDSFYGNYDYVVRQLIAYKTARISQAKIFVFTIPSMETNAESYNAAIRYIAGLYDDVYCIDLYNLYYAEFKSSVISSLFIGGHYRPVAYYVIAMLIKEAINKYMCDHYTDFAYTPWLPLS